MQMQVALCWEGGGGGDEVVLLYGWQALGALHWLCAEGVIMLKNAALCMLIRSCSVLLHTHCVQLDV